MSDNRERATAIHLAVLNAGHGGFGCVACQTIAAALDAAEERGRNSVDIGALMDSVRAEGKLAGIEAVAQHFILTNRPGMVPEIRALQRGGREEP